MQPRQTSKFLQFSLCALDLDCHFDIWSFLVTKGLCRICRDVKFFGKFHELLIEFLGFLDTISEIPSSDVNSTTWP